MDDQAEEIYGQAKPVGLGLVIDTEGTTPTFTNGFGMQVTPISPNCSQQKLPFASFYTQEPIFDPHEEFNEIDDIPTLIAKHYHSYQDEGENAQVEQPATQKSTANAETATPDQGHESFFDRLKEYRSQPQFAMQLNDTPVEDTTNENHEWQQYPFTLELNDIENDRVPHTPINHTLRKKPISRRRHSILSSELVQQSKDSNGRRNSSASTTKPSNHQLMAAHINFPTGEAPTSPYPLDDPLRAHTTSPELTCHRNKRNTYSRRRQLSIDEVSVLTSVFQHCDKPNAQLREQLADQMGMTSRAVQIWFQNKRAKRKKDLATKGTSELTSPNVSATSQEGAHRSDKSNNKHTPQDWEVLQKLVEQLGEVSKRTEATAEALRSPVRAFPASLNKQFSTNRRYSLPLTPNIRRPIPIYPFSQQKQSSPALEGFTLPPSAIAVPAHQLIDHVKMERGMDMDAQHLISVKMEEDISYNSNFDAGDGECETYEGWNNAESLNSLFESFLE